MHVSYSFTHLKTWGPLECPLVWNLDEIGNVLPITSLNMIIIFILAIMSIKHHHHHHHHHHWEKNLTKKVVFALGRISPALTLEERRQTLEIPILLQTNNLSKKNLPIVFIVSKKHKDAGHIDVFQQVSHFYLTIGSKKQIFNDLLLKKEIANNLCLTYKWRILKNSWTQRKNAKKLLVPLFPLCWCYLVLSCCCYRLLDDPMGNLASIGH